MTKSSSRSVAPATHCRPDMRRWIIASLMFMLPAQALADADADSCATAAQHAEREFLLPAGLLGAIGRVESGRGRGGSSWPWTVQANGTGSFFDNRAAALTHIGRLQAQGTKIIDVGCFQVDLFWHLGAFASNDEALDPERNARAAARFLASLHEQTSDWDEAVARYHSSNHLLGAPYRDRVLAGRFGSQLTRAGPAADLFVVAVGYREAATASPLPHVIRAALSD